MCVNNYCELFHMTFHDVSFKAVFLCIGIKSVHVALMAGKAEIRYDPDSMDSAQIVKVIAGLGFGASLMDEGAVSNGLLDLSVSLGCHIAFIICHYVLVYDFSIYTKVKV